MTFIRKYNFIIWILKECGDQFTSKADEILKEVNSSKSLNKEFNEYLEKKEIDINKRNTFSAIVVSSAAWPLKIV